ncbi:class I SAM-dependent methyltransferase [Azospirillum sp. sgz302134]
MPSLPPAAKPNYFSFGYVPSGSLRNDWSGRLFGAPNLLKRLQAPEILAALAIDPADRVLDLGCSSGYITIEMAKLAAEAVGVDINPYVRTIRIPGSLIGRLSFECVSGTALPFPDGHFDKVLASEVLTMIDEPPHFLAEVRRVLKPGGRLVVVNGVGPIPIRDAYRDGSPRLEELRRRYGNRVPASYDDYVAGLLGVAGTATPRFLERDEVIRLVEDNGFHIQDARHSPRRVAGDRYAWEQFELFIREGKVVTLDSFLPKFLSLSFLSLFDRADYKGGLIITAEMPPA